MHYRYWILITPKRAQEIVQLLDDVKEVCFKQGEEEYVYPFAEWKQKREQVKQRLRHLPEYLEKAAEVIVFETPRVGQQRRFDVVKRTTLFLFTRLMAKSNRDMEPPNNHRVPQRTSEYSTRPICSVPSNHL